MDMIVTIKLTFRVAPLRVYTFSLAVRLLSAVALHMSGTRLAETSTVGAL